MQYLYFQSSELEGMIWQKNRSSLFTKFIVGLAVWAIAPLARAVGSLPLVAQVECVGE
jgi:hypothetical protein